MSLKKNEQTLSNRLPYFNFDTETLAIWLKDGSATLSFKITPKDCSNMTDGDLEALRFGLTPIINHLPEGSVLQALLIREKSNMESDEAFKKWLKAHHGQGASEERNLLHESRLSMLKNDFEQDLLFQTCCYLTIRILPNSKISTGKNLGPFSHFAFWFSSKKKEEVKPRNQILTDLESACESLRSGLEALGFEVSLVSKEERLKIIYQWLNPERSKNISLNTNNSSADLAEHVALTDLIENKNGLSLGRTKVTLTTLKSLPEISIPSVMGLLSSAINPFSLLFTVYVLKQTEERERLMRRQRMAQGMASGNTVRNLMAESQLKDIEDTLTALISSGEKLLATSFHLVGLSEGRQ